MLTEDVYVAIQEHTILQQAYVMIAGLASDDQMLTVARRSLRTAILEREKLIPELAEDSTAEDEAT